MDPQQPDPSQHPVQPLPSGANTIHYVRRAGQGVELRNAPTDREVIVIDENTPTPPIPRRQPYVPVGQRRPQGDDDVLYIGPE